MRRKSALVIAFVAVVFAPARGALIAQAARGGQPRPGVGPADRPRVDSTSAERGRTNWLNNCAGCHGEDARGGGKGPNLVQSLVVLRDRYGSVIGPYLKAGHPAGQTNQLMDAQIVDLANLLRQRIDDTLKGSPLYKTRNVLTGDPVAGAAYFAHEGNCTACHSTTGDLVGVATRIADPVQLQQRMVFPNGRGRGGRGSTATVVTVTVTRLSQPVLSGTLVQLDDLDVILRDAAGELHVIPRAPDVKVVKTDPLQAHHDWLDRATDKNIHDLVAFLETLK